MSSSSVKNFNSTIFLSVLLLILVTFTVIRQGAFIKNLQEFEKLLIIKNILSSDTLFKFKMIKGVHPNEQIRKIHTLEFANGKNAYFTLPIFPVNTRFLESDKIQMPGLLFKCICDSNNKIIIDDNFEKKKFFTYKLIVLDKAICKTDMQFSSFVIYVTNTEIVKINAKNEYCLKVGEIAYYLEDIGASTKRISVNNIYRPLERLELNIVSKRLDVIRHINNADTLTDADFYLNSLKDRDTSVKIPLIDLSLDAKKSNNLITIIIVCFSFFGINMLRQSKTDLKRNNENDSFFIFNSTRDVLRTILFFRRIKFRLIRFDSFFILIYHLIGFLSPLLIFIITSIPRYDGEVIFYGISSTLSFLVSIFCVCAYFYNYFQFFSFKSGFKEFTDILFIHKVNGKIISIFLDEEDPVLKTECEDSRPFLKRFFSNIKEILREP